jgi:hypothetical protein
MSCTLASTYTCDLTRYVQSLYSMQEGGYGESGGCNVYQSMHLCSAGPPVLEGTAFATTPKRRLVAAQICQLEAATLDGLLRLPMWPRPRSEAPGFGSD